MDYEKVKVIVGKIRKYPITVSRKSWHKAKVYELQAFIHELEVESNGIIHESYPFELYKSLVNNHYNETTKKELDAKLKYVLIALLSTLESYVYYNHL